MRRGIAIGWVAFVVASGACGGSHSDPPPYALGASGGSYNDGSGRLGLAVLATLRDAGGAGPQAAWSGTLSGASGPLASASYDAAGAASWSAFLWPELAPTPGSYGLALAPAGASGISASFDLADGPGLAVPQVALSPDASALSWPAISGAVTYECRILSNGALQAATLGPAPTCPVGSLPAGTYEAAVRAWSADLTGLAASAAQRPSLPPRFDVSEGRLGFMIPGAGGSAFVATAAGGAIDYSGWTPGLAFWLSIATAAGSPTTSAWTVSVVGPGLPSSTPLKVTYGANLPRVLFWSYDAPATAGIYSFTATSTLGTLAGSFTVGAPTPLAVAQGVTASGGAQGTASATWTAVTGARSYLVSAWNHTSGSLAASEWVAGPPAAFPQGTFASGTTYDVYVAATDADMLGGAAPTQVAVSENTYQPASFTAP